MTVFVDELKDWPLDFVDPAARKHGTRWCHLWTDSRDLEELHLFAEAIGLKRIWFQDHHLVPHYDLVPSKKKLALSKGAQFKSGMERAREQHADKNGLARQT